MGQEVLILIGILLIVFLLAHGSIVTRLDKIISALEKRR